MAKMARAGENFAAAPLAERIYILYNMFVIFSPLEAFLMNKVFRLDRRSVFKIFLLTAVFFFAAHLYRFLSLGFAHDSLVLNQSGDDFWQLSLGRFMQVFYHRIRGNIPVPYIVGLLSYLYLAGSVCLLADLLLLSSTLSISLVSMVMCSNTTLTFASATFLPWLDAYMLALFFAVLCVFCAVRLPKAGWVLAPLSLLVSLGLYPSYSEIAAILCLIVLIGDALDGLSFRPLFLHALKLLLILAVGFILYAVSLKLLFTFTVYQPADSYNSVAKMNNLELASLPGLIRDAYVFPLKWLSHPKTAFSKPVALCYLLLSLFPCIAVARLSFVRRVSPACAALLLVFLLLIPLAANFVYVLTQGMMYEVMIYAFFFVFVLPVCLFDRLRADQGFFRFSADAAALCLVMIYGSDTMFSHQFFLRRELGYDASISLATRILERAETIEGYEHGVTPVVFSGVVSGSRFAMERPGFESSAELDDSLYSFTYEMTYPWFFTRIISDSTRFVSEGERVQLVYRDEVLAMPVFPAEGSLKMIDGVLVVRLNRTLTSRPST